jgi:hypothetical protein
MTWISSAISSIGGTGVALLGSSLLGAFGANKQAGAASQAADLQAQAAQRAADQQMQMFNIQNEQGRPYREAGYGALTKIQDMLPYLTKQVTAQDLSSMPGFTFGLNQGVGAAGQAANVGGGGSNVDTARQKFAIDYATNVGMPQYLNQRTGIYNTLAGIAGIGQTAQNQSQALGQSVAGNIGQLGIGGASALGAGNIGAANAYANLGQNIGNQATLYSLMRPQGGSSVNLSPAISLAPGATVPSDYPIGDWYSR